MKRRSTLSSVSARQARGGADLNRRLGLCDSNKSMTYSICSNHNGDNKSVVEPTSAFLKARDTDRCNCPHAYSD
jgi:hypothetical protein